MARNMTFATLLFIAISCSLPEETPLLLEEGVANEVGFSEKKLSNIDVMINNYMEQNKLPGAVALVARKGKIVKHKAYGSKNIARDINQKKDDIFRIASMTKAITAVAAFTLLEEGKFDLDDPLWWYIPEFRNSTILDDVNFEDSTYTSHPTQNEIKIRQLFNHTSGIGYGYQDEKLNAIYVKNNISEGFEHRDILLKDNITRLAKLPLVHEPGETWTYGLSYDVLGYLIEVISEKPLDKFFQERIFDPLGMNDTHFYLPEEKYNRLPDVFMSSHEGVVATDYELIHYPIKGAKKYLSGGADLSCTALDYAKFAQMIMNGGVYNGNRILGIKTIEWITKGQVEGGIKALGWGFGVVETKEMALQYASAGSNKWGGYFSTQCLMDPEEKIIAILMLQMDPNWEWGVHSRFQNIVYASIVDNEL